MADKAKNGKSLGDLMNDLFGSKKKKTSSSSNLLVKTSMYYKIALVVAIIAIVFAGAVFLITYTSYMSEHAPAQSYTPTYTQVPTAVPTPTPVPTPTTAISKLDTVKGTVEITGSISPSTEVTYQAALEPWVLDTATIPRTDGVTTYLTVYRVDESKNLLIFEDKRELTVETPDVSIPYPAGTFALLTSPDASAALTNAATSPYTDQLAKAPAGDLFVVAWNTGFEQEQAIWKKAGSLTLENGAWKTYQVRVTVTAADVPMTADNGGMSTITIAYPWRIAWQVTGSQDSDPYSNAEFILSRTDGTIVDTFGWKGIYSSSPKQSTAVYQPGEYVLAVYLRGCGAALEFQHSAGPVYFENATVIDGGSA